MTLSCFMQHATYGSIYSENQMNRNVCEALNGVESDYKEVQRGQISKVKRPAVKKITGQVSEVTCVLNSSILPPVAATIWTCGGEGGGGGEE